MHISVNVYYALFLSYLREPEIWSFIIQIIHVQSSEILSLALQDMLSDPVSLFVHFMSFFWNSFFLSIENINIC
jgi:hypothetical protein